MKVPSTLDGRTVSGSRGARRRVSGLPRRGKPTFAAGFPGRRDSSGTRVFDEQPVGRVGQRGGDERTQLTGRERPVLLSPVRGGHRVVSEPCVRLAERVWEARTRAAAERQPAGVASALHLLACAVSSAATASSYVRPSSPMRHSAIVTNCKSIATSRSAQCLPVFVSMTSHRPSTIVGHRAEGPGRGAEGRSLAPRPRRQRAWRGRDIAEQSRWG